MRRDAGELESLSEAWGTGCMRGAVTGVAEDAGGTEGIVGGSAFMVGGSDDILTAFAMGKLAYAVAWTAGPYMIAVAFSYSPWLGTRTGCGGSGLYIGTGAPTTG
jgi:hypothetical protein